ncbi:MAG: hypothetical protein WKF37_04815 [Bryobacteraceae bacterium]
MRRVSKRITFATLPTLEQRQGILGIAVRDPYTGVEYTNGVIPPARITRFAREVLAGLPAPNRPGISNNFESQPRREEPSNKGDFRYDHYFGSRITAFGRYSHRELNQFEPPSIPGPSGGDANGNVRVYNRQIVFGTNLTLSATRCLNSGWGSRPPKAASSHFVGEEGVAQRFGFPNVPSDPRFTGGIIAEHQWLHRTGSPSSNPSFRIRRY